MDIGEINIIVQIATEEGIITNLKKNLDNFSIRVWEALGHD